MIEDEGQAKSICAGARCAAILGLGMQLNMVMSELLFHETVKPRKFPWTITVARSVIPTWPALLLGV